MRLPWFFLPIVAVLGGCSNLGSAVGNAAQAYWNSRNPPSYAQTPLQAQFTYLEVLSPNNSALLVLAQIDNPPQGVQPVETWFSATGEVLRTQGGFFVGSQGVTQLPESAVLSWGNTGNPERLEFNMPSVGLSKVPMVWQSADIPSLLLKNPNPLMKRALQVPNLKINAWVARNTSLAPRLNAYREVFQLVATDPATGRLVYGQHCVGGLVQGQCVQYLLRTAARNL